MSLDGSTLSFFYTYPNSLFLPFFFFNPLYFSFIFFRIPLQQFYLNELILTLIIRYIILRKINMKKATLLLFLLLMTTASFSQGMISLFGRANDFFDLLEKQKFAEAHAFFDANLQTKVPAAELQKLWGELNSRYGKFESAAAVQGKAQGEYFTVVIDAKFANDTQSFIMGFDKTEKIAGFFLRPRSTAATYLNPAYADTTLYSSKEIYIKTPGHSLVGLLTTPKKVSGYPIVVLVHGSGPSDMDATIGPNKPFKDLAAGLAAKGIASIRYVKRTMIYSGEFGGVFTVKEETIDDALAAIALAGTLPDVDKKQIYLFGHSLGGMLAPKIAAMAPALKGLILAEAPARKFTDLMVEQNKYMYEMSKDTTQAGKKQLANALTELERSRITQAGTMKPDSAILGIPVSYWVDLNNYNQVETAKKLNKRMLIFQGANDFQVSVADFDLWSAALGKKSNVTLKLYPDLNHLMSSQLEKGSVAQYQQPASVSETLINDVVAWIKQK
jgi:dienelactone hydrolase